MSIAQQMKKPKVQMGFDIISPYSYLAFKIMNKYESLGVIEVDYVPVYLPGIFKISGNQPPMNRGKNKRNYLIQDLNNMAKFADVPLRVPTKFPIDTKLVQIALVLIKQRHQEVFHKAIEIFYDGFFVKGLGLNELEVVEELLTQLALNSSQIDQLITDIQRDDSKSKLMESTKVLVTAGAYGLPYFITSLPQPHQQHYFGCDRIELMLTDLGINYQGPNPNSKKIESDKLKFKIQFAMDISSPYAFFARKVLKRYEKVWDINIEYMPLYLRTCVSEAGNVSPVAKPGNKTKYTLQDTGRISHFFRAGFKLPTKFPFDSLLAQTLLREIKINVPEKFVDCMDLLWEGALSYDLDIKQTTTIQNLLAPHFTDPQLLTNLIQSSTTKISQQALIDESKKWVKEKGIFGMPFIIIEKEDGKAYKLFGSDRIELLAHITGQKYGGPKPKL